MKLGDSMAPIEAHSAWNDLCARKTRPPKIGDIPRHVAVDEESPGCTSSRSLGQFSEEKSRTSMLERSTSCQTERGRSKISETLPVIEDFLKLTFPTKTNGKTPQIPVERIDCSISIDETLEASLPVLNDFSKNITTEDQLEILQKKSSLRVAESNDFLKDETPWDNEIPDQIYEVRRDSALYIDERHIESLTLGDNILAVSEVSSSPKTLGLENLCESVEEAGISRLSKPRARRESSGYFSNLGTFDEDRWITNTMDLGNQQDVMTARDISRERRRSSTKSRLPNAYNQLQRTVQSPCGQQIGKIPNLVRPTDHPEVAASSPSVSEFSAIAKISRAEMPNIEEQMSLEFEKSTYAEHRDDNETSVSSKNEYGVLTDATSRISLKDASTRDADEFMDMCGNNDQLANDVTVRNFSGKVPMTKSSDVTETTNQRSPETSDAQRAFIVAQQCGSSAVTNIELERTVEKPSAEREDKRINESVSQIENISQYETTKGDQYETEEEDDDDQVVTAHLECKVEQSPLANLKKSLPKTVKVYQLLSTQSEDRTDDNARMFDRRISLQITRQTEDETTRKINRTPFTKEQQNRATLSDEKKLVHADSVPLLKIPSSTDPMCAMTDATIVDVDQSATLRLLSGSNASNVCDNERLCVADKSSGSSITGIRPIYPYCPYSPYASPQGSPRTTRRRPLRESRRVSIDSRQGALQLNQYKLLNNIGQGSYGIVKLAYNEEDDTHYAMKILSKKKLMKKAGIFGRIAPGRKGSTNPLAKVYREIALLKKLDHPNVVKLVEVLDDPDEDNLYLVFELVQRGEVLQLPTDKPLDEETARKYFRDVVMGVEYLHYQRIVHRDIKPSNLLVDSEGRVKVADLGVSAELRVADELLSGSAGTPAFAAPETTTPGAQYSGTLCDVWSMGVTLYSLVTGKVPWDGAGSIISVQAAIRTEPLRFPDKPSLSSNLCDLVSRMLAKDPKRRMSLAEIKEHHWLTKDGSESLPDEAENCRLPVTVTDEEVARVVTRVPKLDTLILIKTMLKQHSFQNPFLPRRSGKSAGGSVANGSPKTVTKTPKESITTNENLKTKTEQFQTSGRSNSAPDSYEWQTNGRQISNDSLLPPVTEASSQETEIEKR